MSDEKISELTDAQLIRRFQKGDKSVFAHIIDRYQEPLFTYLFRFVGNRQVAEDIFQDTFLKVMKNLKDYREQGKFGSWLFGIAHHLTVDFLRKENRYQKIFSAIEEKQKNEVTLENIPESNPLPDLNIEQKELRRILNDAVSRLSNEQKEVFLLREHSELTFKEIANLLNRPLNTVLAQMRYALQNLRKILTKEYHGEISHVL